MNLRRQAVPLAIVIAAHIGLAFVPTMMDEAPPRPRTVVRLDFSEPPEPEPEPPEPEPELPEPEPEQTPEPPPRTREPTPQPRPDPVPEPTTPEPQAAPIPAPDPEPPPPVADPKPEPKPQPEPSRPVPVPGKGKADMRGYAKGIFRAMQGCQHYPASAKRLGLEGKGAVKIRIDRKGNIVGEPTMHTSTGHDVFDQEALAMVRCAAPFDAPPQEFDKDVATLAIPVHFKLK